MGKFKNNKKNKKDFLESECLSCGSTKEISTDHVYPQNLGGVSDFFNYMTLCKSCNTQKGDVLPVEWLKTLKQPKHKKDLEEIVEFCGHIYTGEIAYDKLGSLRCSGCNPEWTYRLDRQGGAEKPLPNYYTRLLSKGKLQRLFDHLDCSVVKEKDMQRILYSEHKDRAVRVIDGSFVTKAQVIACSFPDKSKVFLPAMTKVTKRDKFFVRSVNSCYCEVLLEGKNYYVLEELVHYQEENGQ